MNKTIILQNRAVISISGVDKRTFLQGLITNDINKASEKQAIYTFMLSPQGRFLYDFFIIEKNDELLIDCDLSRIDEIVQKLSFFKLRSKVEINKRSDLAAASCLNADEFTEKEISFIDPRSEEMGFRGLINYHPNGNENSDINEYHFRRYELKLPDDSDLTYDKSFLLEFGFDSWNAIDYKKGCYVGQETTARMHYKGTIRKKVFLAEVIDSKIEKGSLIENEGKKIGEVLSSILHQNKIIALVLIKNIDNEGKEVNLKSLKLSPEMVLNSQIATR